MGKNRNSLSLIAAILEAASEASSKTHIMYQANLSFTLLEKYLGLASDSGLVELSDYKYQLTPRGKEFLKTYRHFEQRYLKAQEMLEALGSEREQLSKAFMRSQGMLEDSESVLETK